jgi:membrane protease YdiL (CAAX protease family)
VTASGASSVARGVVAFVTAAVVALLITAYGQGLWGLLVVANLRFHPELPWAAIAMAILLVLLILYLSGQGWPRSTRTTRRALLRWNAVPPPVVGWAILAGVLADVAMGGTWIAASDLTHIPQGVIPKMTGYPLVTVLSFLIMGSIAAPVSEEAAFRGYAQGLLERAWRWGPAAIIGSSILFAAAHVLQGLSIPKLGLYFLAGLIFGTLAWLTNSLYAAMMVHSLADIEGFLVLWPHDAHPHALVTEGGHDPLFLPAIAAVAILGPLSILAFLRLAGMTAGSRVSGRSNPVTA